MRLCSFVVTLAVLTAVVTGQTKTKGSSTDPAASTGDLGEFPDSEKLITNPCKVNLTCGECIAAHPLCAWCEKENFTDEGKSRCDLYESLQHSTCSKNIVYPGKEFGPVTSKHLSQPGAKPADVVQLAPQEVHLKLRPKDPHPLSVKFQQAVDYPVDLYYLMDLSKSMEDDKDKLASLGNLLAEEMRKITGNFRLGFGSFVDKTVMPYVSTVPEKLKAPCTGCAAPYGFKNHMQLSENTTAFADEVRNARVSGNLDAPEGGFDAIMQSIVCHNEIGWRNKSRKMLVFSTDSGFHYAGDGKLGGIVTPNDGICHLDSNGYYTESRDQDYPSLSQIRHKVNEKKVNIIFAVTGGQVRVYEELSKNLDGSYTGELANDSSNVVQLVKDQYSQISSEVELQDNAPKHINVTYFSNCLGNTREKTNICKGLKVGDSVEFTAEIQVLYCPKNRSEWTQTFQISPVGVNEALTVHLSMICDCECEHKGEPFSSKCEGHGTFECGICKCDKDYDGKICECGPETLKHTDDATCKKPNSTLICSGQGACSCGTCTCHTRKNPHESIYGKFCECDNFSCDKHEGKICSGHGNCICSACVCDPGWEGNDCRCPSGDAICVGPNGKVCSGNGDCSCGECKCKERFSGPFCEECPTCLGKCDEFSSCVQCRAFQTGPHKDNCSACFDVERLPEVKVENPNERLCVFKDEDDCKFTFVYGYDANQEPKVRVQETKECPPPVNILMIVLAVIGGIVAIGLCLLLIWKLLTTIHDRREFAKFEKERQMAKWDAGENPIFKQATSTFKNPTYGGKQ